MSHLDVSNNYTDLPTVLHMEVVNLLSAHSDMRRSEDPNDRKLSLAIAWPPWAPNSARLITINLLVCP